MDADKTPEEQERARKHMFAWILGGLAVIGLVGGYAIWSYFH